MVRFYEKKDWKNIIINNNAELKELLEHYFKELNSILLYEDEFKITSNLIEK